MFCWGPQTRTEKEVLNGLFLADYQEACSTASRYGTVLDSLLFHVREICICEAAEYIKIWNSFNKRRNILVAGWDKISLLYRCVQDVSNRHCDKIPVLFGNNSNFLTLIAAENISNIWQQSVASVNISDVDHNIQQQ
jgi:hypothetical protein